MKQATQNKTISFKLSVVVGVATCVMVGVLIFYSIVRLRSSEIKAAQGQAVALAREYAGRLKATIGVPLDASRTFSASLAALKDEKLETSISREDVNAMLKKFVEKDSSILGAYTIWEPNAFDGKDSLYANTPGHDQTGRFIPYWVRSNGRIIIEPNVGYETQGVGDYYQIPKQTRQETAIDPYLYTISGKQVLIMSLVSPIIENNQFFGITGADISLEWLQNMIDAEQKQIFNGSGQLYIISHNGTIAAATGKKELLGKKISSLYQGGGQKINQISAENFLIENDSLKAYVPLYFGHSKKPWQICITVPVVQLTKNAQAEMYKMLILSIVFLLAFVMLVSYLLRKQIHPIIEVSSVAEQVAQGNLEIEKVKANSQEIETLNEAFFKVVESQREITHVCAAIASGDFSKQALVKSEKDQLAKSVNQMNKSLQHAAQEDAKRSWAAEGLAKLGEIVRADNDQKTQADHILAYLVKYMQANQGALFIVNDTHKENHYLEMITCYAYERKKFIEKRIEIGEGLIGQCYLEKSSIYLTQIPDNYVQISSGLGKANPSSILIVALINNGSIEGVLELASFYEIKEHEILFIEKAAQSIASTIATVKINQRTKQLLEQAQQQAEELRAQEEEMRQNMEELNATQEEIQRKEKGYVEKIKNLQQLLAAHDILVDLSAE